MASIVASERHPFGMGTSSYEIISNQWVPGIVATAPNDSHPLVEVLTSAWTWLVTLLFAGGAHAGRHEIRMNAAETSIKALQGVPVEIAKLQEAASHNKDMLERILNKMDKQ